MRLLLAFLLFAFSLSSSLAQEVYKTVDENGKIIFSDKPTNEDSEKIDTKLKNVQPGTTFRSYKKDAKKETPISIQITSPSDGQQIGPTQKRISIGVKVSPQLNSDLQVTIFFDGKIVSGPSRSTSASIPLTIKMRGKHSISAKVTDTTGKTIASSNSVSVQVIRP